MFIEILPSANANREKATLLEGLFYDHEYGADVRYGYDPFGRPWPIDGTAPQPAELDDLRAYRWPRRARCW